MKTAVIYARYSSERQTEQSIEGQLRVCHEFAERNDLKIIDTYIDRAMTGTNDNRAAFQKMLSDSDKPQPWEIVLVYMRLYIQFQAAAGHIKAKPFLLTSTVS